MASAEILNPVEDDSYDRELAAHPEAGIFHSSAWAKVIGREYGWKAAFLVIRRKGKLCSLLPMMEGQSVFKGKRAVSIPFADFCPVLAENENDAKELWSRALVLGRERRWKYIELRGSPRVRPAATPSVSFWGHILELGPDENALFDGVDSSARRAVRKARDCGVVVQRAETIEGVRIFYRLHCKTRKKHGLPPQPWSFFSNIYEHILSKGFGLLLVARCEGKPISSAMFFHWGKQAIYKFGASDPASDQLRGNNLVMWEGITFYSKSGVHQLHFGRTSRNNDGLRRYKLGWGAREHEIEYQKFDFRAARFVSDKDRAEGWHNQIFNKIPAALLRAAGGILYRHME